MRSRAGRWRVLEVTPKTPGPVASADLFLCVRAWMFTRQARVNRNSRVPTGAWLLEGN